MHTRARAIFAYIAVTCAHRRYFVLTRKGLHYYVRKHDSGDSGTRRDLFGEHEGSIALGNIARIDIVDDVNKTFVIVSKSGGRKFLLRAGSHELYQRWVGTLQTAIDPHAVGRSGSGTSFMRGKTGSSSFPRIPTLLDFRMPPRTDNLANITLYSGSLGLEVLLESGLPWGVHTHVERGKHRVTACFAPNGGLASSDVIRLFLEGGATASVPLSRTLLRRASGSAIVTLQGSSLHKAVRLSWEPVTPPTTPQPPAVQLPPDAGASSLPSATLHWAGTSRRHARPLSGWLLSASAAAAALGAAGFLAVASRQEDTEGASVARALLSPTSSTSLLTCAAIAFATWTYVLEPQQHPAPASHGGSSAWRLDFLSRWLPKRMLTRLPAPLARTLATVNQPYSWRLAFEPASVDGSAQADGRPVAVAGETARHLQNLVPQSPARTATPTSDGELQVDALFADVASQEHSVLYHAAMSLRQAKSKSPYLSGKAEAYPATDAAAGGAPSGAGAPAADAAAVPDLHLDSMLKAFELSVISVLSALGPAMLILVKNDQANLRKVKDAAAAAAVNSPDARITQSIRALLEDEMRRGMHAPGAVVTPATPASPAPAPAVAANMRSFPPSTIGHAQIGCTGGATLYDPSASMSLLWLGRTLNLTLIIMENLLHAKDHMDDDALVLGVQMLDDVDNPEPTPAVSGDPVADAVRDGYAKTLRPFHSWLLRKTFDLVSSQLPSFDDAMVMFGSGLGDAEREGKVCADIRLYVEEGRPVAAALDKIFAELKLEDLRQV